MTLEAVIDSLNKFVKSKLSADYFYVLQREIIPSKTAKAYKEINITLWKCFKTTNHNDSVLLFKNVERVVGDEQMEEFIKTSEENFLVTLFDYVYSLK